jgi:putative MATE family efflux protein
MLKLAAPMVLGMGGLFMFQTIDSLFVGQLGVLPLAALGFTMPVTLGVMSASIGIGVGTTAVIGRALGQGDPDQVRRLTTDALLLGVALVAALAMVGLLTIDPLFRSMGATEETLPLIRDYMVPWYCGVGCLVIPMVGNSAIRATGDTTSPMVIMLISGVVNLILDPLLIFGWGPFPRLEIRGAAVATVCSWVVTFGAALWVLHYRERMLDWRRVPVAQILSSWKRILRIGLPAASSNLTRPLSTGILTALVAPFGADAVAAYGVGMRIELVALVGIHAMAVAVTPMTAQNLGAQRFPRIAEVLRFGALAAAAWGLFVGVLLALFAAPIAQQFKGSQAVTEGTVLFLTIVPLSYPLLGSILIANALLNGLGASLRAVSLVLVRAFVFAIPMALVGAHYFGLPGLFGGLGAANLIGGATAWFYATRFLKRRFPTPAAGR